MMLGALDADGRVALREQPVELGRRGVVRARLRGGRLGEQLVKFLQPPDERDNVPKVPAWPLDPARSG